MRAENAVSAARAEMTFPCLLLMKIVGKNDEHLVTRVTQIVQKIDPQFQPRTIQTKPSSQGSYLSLTCSVNFVDRSAFEKLYADLKAEPLVKWAL